MNSEKNNSSIVRSNRIGIMGGTFDPIHFGDLVTAEAARVRFNLNHVIFVPSGKPPHKKERAVTESNHRYLMTLLATATNPYFEVSRIEVDQEGYTYTIDTIKRFMSRFGENTDFYFITGADALNEIFTWKNPEGLLKLCKFVAAARPGYKKEELLKEIKFLKENYNSKVSFVEVPSLAISSTDIRQRVKNNLPIKYLLPELSRNLYL